MSGVALRVERVSKQYRIGQRAVKHDTLREAITEAAAASVRSLSRGFRGGASSRPTIWALRNVSFEVGHGEVLGVIGPNGAGKSTLLKVLSRITEPTTGRVEGYGRVGSLLEVGTGFHPELTGRENIYLNGSILGMRKVEVRRKFDEIVSFSGVETFLDTPVKRYSSGMYVRLAFAVAAHLEPEILIVDEVLAVGDVEFQKRCLRKMEGVARGGRTVLLVSHNMGTVQAFCTRAILLREGVVVMEGSAAAAVGTYLRGLEEIGSQDLLNRQARGGLGEVRLQGIEVSSEGTAQGVLACGRSARFVLHVDRVRPGMTCAFTIYDQLGQQVTYFDSEVQGNEDTVAAHGEAQFCCEVDELLLIPGRYRINVGIMAAGELQDHVEAAAFFDVEEGTVRGRPIARTPGSGSIIIPHRWITPRR